MNRVKFIKQYMKGRTIDIGCESGILHQLIYNKNVYGLDIHVKKHKEKVVKGDAQAMPFKDNTFNTIIAGELIEHLQYPEKFLKECKRILLDNGTIIISTPNKNSWVNRIFKSSFHPTHISLFDTSSIRKIVSDYFIIQKIFFLPYDSVSSWGSKHKRFYWLRKLIHYFLPSSLQENIIILGKNRK